MCPNPMSVFSGKGRPLSNDCKFVGDGGSLPLQASLEGVHVPQGALALLDPSAYGKVIQTPPLGISNLGPEICEVREDALALLDPLVIGKDSTTDTPLRISNLGSEFCGTVGAGVPGVIVMRDARKLGESKFAIESSGERTRSSVEVASTKDVLCNSEKS